MAWYRTGTVAVTNGSAVVTGTGTAFVASVQAAHAFNGPDGRVYEVASVDSNTQITLASNYAGSTASGQSYSIVPTQGFAQSLVSLVTQFITTYQGFTSTALAGKFADGTAATPGVSFSADQDTGFYRPASNTLGLTAGGVAKLLISTIMRALGDTTLGVTFDLIGNGANNSSLMRAMASDQTTVLGYLGWGSPGVMIMSSTTDVDITSGSANAVNLTAGSTTISFIAGAILPGTDNSVSIGNSSRRMSTIYAATGAISTSDERIKTWRGSLTAAEMAAAKEIAGAIGIFQFNDAIARKGPDRARWHTGVKAQQVVSILTSHGLDPMRYGFVCYDEWDAVAAVPAQPAIAGIPEVRDENGILISPAISGMPAVPGRPGIAAGNLYSIRSDELAFFIAAAQEQRLLALEAYVAAHPAA